MSPVKILTHEAKEGTYTCYLTLDDQIEMTVFQPADRIIGTQMNFTQLPWEVRAAFEAEMDPHNL